MTDSRNQPSTAAAGLLLGAVILIVFGRSLGADLVWDDKNLISMNMWLSHGDTFWRTWTQDFWLLTNSSSQSGMYRPMVIDSYWLEHRLWGTTAAGYHAVNLLLHLANATLLFVFARRLQVAGSAALVGSLFFAIHPVQVEAAASVASRTDLLATFFILCGCLLWTGSERSRKLALAPIFLALCSKESAVIAPLLLLLVDRRIGRPIFSKWSFWATLPWLPWLALRSRAVGFGSEGLANLNEWQGGARIFSYLSRVVVPLPQGPITELPTVALSVAIGSALLLVGLSIALLRLPSRKRLVFASLWILLALLPVSELVPVGARYTDLLLYLAMCGLSIGLSDAMESANKALSPQSRIRNYMVGLAALCLFILGLTSFSWTGVWADDLSLWSRGVHHNPDSITANLNLGNALRSNGRRAEGCSQLEATWNLVDVQKAPGTASRVAYNLGNCAREQGQWDLAVERYQNSAQLSNGRFLPARFNLATTYGSSERAEMGLEETKRLLLHAPEFARTWHIHGVMLAKLGRYEEAIAAFERALSIDSENTESVLFLDRARKLSESHQQESERKDKGTTMVPRSGN
jgi:tetratricopeptide (TPR) repeat protein